MSELETHQVRIAMLPLTDAAPLVVAHMQGFFAEEQLDVELVVLQSWAQVRDAIQLGQVEAAQLLPLMPLAATLGLDGLQTPIITPLTLNRNGNAISLSNYLYQQTMEALPEAQHQTELRSKALATVIRRRQHDGLPALRFAHVHSFSSHHYLLRAWLAEADIDPDKDVELRVVPPSLMGDYMAKGMIDGFCVGAPWSDVAAEQGVSTLFVRCEEIWPHAQEKLFGVNQHWMEAHPKTHLAMLRAIIRAGQWLDSDAEHRLAASQLLVENGYLGPDIATVRHELYERFKQRSSADVVGIEFFRNGAQQPSSTQLLWYAGQLKRWGVFTDEERLREVIQQTVRNDVYEEAVTSFKAAGIFRPAAMEPFDVAGQRFDPEASFPEPHPHA